VVKTPVSYKTSNGLLNRKALEHTVAVLKRGGVIVLPTKTVYGVGVALHVEGAIEKLFKLKSRDRDKPIARFVPDINTLTAEGADIDDCVRRLAERFWPGPLTLVVRHGSEWTGYRIPEHPAALQVLQAAGCTLAVTSANRSGYPAARDAEEAREQLGDAVDVYIDAGPAEGGIPSTVVRVLHSGVDILRKGAILEREILVTAGLVNDA
jgi:tRNA threonylcarbamoyl adenosine modification protein (Sua5/YciO/YrdC/YwlC family)